MEAPDVTECFLSVQSQSVVSSAYRSSWHKLEYKLRRMRNIMSLVWLKSLQKALLYLCLSMLVSIVVLRRERERGRQLGVSKTGRRQGRKRGRKILERCGG